MEQRAGKLEPGTTLEKQSGGQLDEPKVVAILEKEDNLVQRHGSASEICRIYLKRIEHVCFKFDPEAMEQRAGKLEPGTTLAKQYRLYVLLRALGRG